jgi:RimJ/RimL family protein N-acetyltransferase
MAFREGRIIRAFSLKGRDVVFRYPKKGDLGNFLRHINSLVDERACIAMQKKITRAKEKKYLEELFREIRKGDKIKVCVEVDGRYAGDSSISRKKGHAMSHVITVGIALGKDFRNMGIGSELLKTMETLGRKEMKGRVLEISYLQMNDRARHVYEKAGFREVGRIPMGARHYGKYMDHVLMVKALK